MVLPVNKHQALLRATELLAQEDDSVLRYVCLEVRCCIEFVAYEKLLTYSSRLPKSVRKWQPPQFFKALLQIEPDAGRSFVLRFSAESAPGQPTGQWRTLGAHRTFSVPWLTEHYHKLGSYLHAPFPDDNRRIKQTDATKMRTYLKCLLPELETVVSSKLDSSFAEVVTFECQRCNQPIACNTKGLRNTRRAICLDPNCNSEYFAEEQPDRSFTFLLEASSLPCQKCGVGIPIENRLLAVGFEFPCESCGAIHLIAQRQWGNGLKDGQ
jgi:hypothetical protein